MQKYIWSFEDITVEKQNILHDSEKLQVLSFVNNTW